LEVVIENYLAGIARTFYRLARYKEHKREGIGGHVRVKEKDIESELRSGSTLCSVTLKLTVLNQYSLD